MSKKTEGMLAAEIIEAAQERLGGAATAGSVYANRWQALLEEAKESLIVNGAYGGEPGFERVRAAAALIKGYLMATAHPSLTQAERGKIRQQRELCQVVVEALYPKMTAKSAAKAIAKIEAFEMLAEAD